MLVRPGRLHSRIVSHQPLDPQFTCWQAVLRATLFQLPALQIF